MTPNTTILGFACEIGQDETGWYVERECGLSIADSEDDAIRLMREQIIECEGLRWDGVCWLIPGKYNIWKLLQVGEYP